MSTVVKNIRQHSFEVPNYEEFVEIAKRYTTVKNYVYSRFSGIHSLTLLKSYKKDIRDLWTDKASGFASQWKLPARYWKLALDEAIANIKSEWSNTKNRIRVAIRNNFNLSEEERQFMYYILKADALLQAILAYQTFEWPKKIKELVIRETYIFNLIRRYVRKYKGKISYSTRCRSFQVDPPMYSYLMKEEKPYLEITSLVKNKRISIPLRDRNVHTGALKIILLGNHSLEIHRSKKVKVKPIHLSEKDENVIGIDKGYTDLFVLSNGSVYGEKLNRFMSDETERLNVKNQRRQRVWQQMEDLKAQGKLEKAERIHQNNFGKIKYNHQKHRADERLKSYINHGILKMIHEEKPSQLVVEELTFTSWNKKLKKGTKRKLNRWVKGYIQQRLDYNCQLYGIEIKKVNPAYTSQVCHQCGSFGERNGKVFKCQTCGTFDADYNASVNIKGRLSDAEIHLYTPYKEVKKILEKRIKEIKAN